MSKEKMLVLIGESASGKSTVQGILEEKYGIKKVVTYTTRPMRDGERNGVDYHFVDDATFDRMVENQEFLEYASYRGWKYGTAAGDCGRNNTSIALTPAGLRSMKRKDIPCLSFYISVDRRSRLIKLLNRGDDIEEAYRRSLSDVGQFDAVNLEVDMEVRNDGYVIPAETIADFIAGVYSAAIKEEH